MRNLIRQLTINDISQVFKIEEEVGKIDVSLVIKSTNEEILKCINSKKSTGIFAEEELIAYTLCYTDEYESIAYIEKCATKENHKGNKYHIKTLNLCLDFLSKEDYILAIALVSPTNLASMKNFKNCLFEEKAVRNNLYNCINKRKVMICYLK